MPHDSSEFDFGLDADFDAYDPLEDNVPDEDEGEPTGDQVPQPNSELQGEIQQKIKPKADEQPASARIEELFKEMAPRRRVLIGILRYLQQPQSADSLVDKVDELQEFDYSVYTAANYGSLLERAGAIKKVNEDGADFDETMQQEPEVVEVDGAEFLKPAPPLQVYWVNTEDGQAYLDADAPLERLYDLLDSSEKYHTIYKRILAFLDEGDGRKITEVNAIVDKDPLVQKPRLYAPHFIDRLEKCDAIEWRGAWRITDIGKLGLERLADVVDDYVPQADTLPASQTEAEAAPAPADDASGAAADAPTQGSEE